MANRFGDESFDREEQFDRDAEREGACGRYLPYRSRTRVPLIPTRSTAGVLQPMVVVPPTKTGGLK